MITKRLLQAISISLFFIAGSFFYVANVQSQDRAHDFARFMSFTEAMKNSGNGSGTGDNNLTGWRWRQNDSGNVQDTGNNYGSGEIQDNSGTLQGTGDNYGSGEIQNNSGILQGTGDNYGSGE